MLENQVGNRRERLQLIGWVGENQVELPLCGFDEAKNVFTNDDVALSLEFLGAIFDELHVLGIGLQPLDSISNEMLPVPENRSSALMPSKSM